MIRCTYDGRKGVKGRLRSLQENSVLAPLSEYVSKRAQFDFHKMPTITDVSNLEGGGVKASTESYKYEST